jgi:hypothetical protein
VRACELVDLHTEKSPWFIRETDYVLHNKCGSFLVKYCPVTNTKQNEGGQVFRGFFELRECKQYRQLKL